MVTTHIDMLQTFRTETKELKSTLQMLEIELQSHLSMVCIKNCISTRSQAMMLYFQDGAY